MGRRRSDTIRDGQLGTVHVISRCTRRAFLMGGENAHRRDWLLAELDSLLDGFCIDLLGYAVMSNHMHLILRPRPDVVAGWEPHRVETNAHTTLSGNKCTHYSLTTQLGSFKNQE